MINAVTDTRGRRFYGITDKVGVPGGRLHLRVPSYDQSPIALEILTRRRTSTRPHPTLVGKNTLSNFLGYLFYGRKRFSNRLLHEIKIVNSGDCQTNIKAPRLPGIIMRTRLLP